MPDESPQPPLVMWAGRLLAAPVRAAVIVDRFLGRPLPASPTAPAQFTFLETTDRLARN